MYSKIFKVWSKVFNTGLLTISCFLLGIFSNAQVVSIPVFMDKEDTDTLQETLQILEAQLNRSSSIKFEKFSENEFNGEGILLSAKPSSIPAYGKMLKKLGAEGVIVKSTGKSLVVIGNSRMAVQSGIFIYLENLGFRYYFPHPDWHIIPSNPSLYKSINYIGQPSYDHRRIWYGYGTVGSKFSDDNYKFWFKANKLGGSMQAFIGHAYDDIVSRNEETFKQHPEWFYPQIEKGKIPDNPKFDLANKSLIQFIISDVFKRLEQAKAKGAPLKMITMSPSDGEGTCNTPACKNLGSTVTDRVYYLINTVAKSVSEKYPGTWISGMSYSEYAAPPTKKLEPNTFVSIATAFNNTKYTTDQLINEWSKKAGKVGIYDYLGLYVWDYDIPGKGQGSNVRKVAASIKRYHRSGAQGYDAETTPGSINKGLGHYIVSKLLWDVNANPETISKTFFEDCFGRSAVMMQGLWGQWEKYPYTNVRESDLAEWIDLVAQAERQETSAAVHKRLTHVKTYLHYIYLYNKFKATPDEANRISLLNFAYNTFDWAAFSGYPMLWVLGQGTGIAGFKFNDPNAKYKTTNPAFKEAKYINELIESDRKLLKKKPAIPIVNLPRQFKKTTVPPIFGERQYTIFKGTTMLTGIHYFVFEVKNASSNNYIDIAGGFVTGGGSDKPITLSVTNYKGSIETDSKVLLKYDYTGKMDTQRISLNKLPKGYYLLKADDPKKYFKIAFGADVSYAMIATGETPFWGYSRYMSFQVPAGTKRFRVFKEIEAILVSPAGRKVDMSQKRNEEIDVDVLAGETGLWMINFVNGKFHIEGVPPFINMEPAQIIIPKDVANP